LCAPQDESVATPVAPKMKTPEPPLVPVHLPSLLCQITYEGEGNEVNHHHPQVPKITIAMSLLQCPCSLSVNMRCGVKFALQ